MKRSTKLSLLEFKTIKNLHKLDKTILSLEGRATKLKRLEIHISQIIKKKDSETTKEIILSVITVTASIF